MERLEIFQALQAKRTPVTTWVDSSHFDECVVGFYVRIEDSDKSGFSIGRIEEIRMGKPYKLNDNACTKYMCVYQPPSPNRVVPIIKLSDEPFTLSEVENWEVNLAILKLPVAHTLSKEEALNRIVKLSEVEVQIRAKVTQKKSFDSERYRYSDRIDYTSTSGLQKSIALFERKAREQEQEISRLRRSNSKSNMEKQKGVAGSTGGITRTPKSKSPREKVSSREFMEPVTAKSKSTTPSTKSKVRPGSEIRAPSVNVKSVNENIISGLPTKPSSQKSPRKKAKDESKTKEKTSSDSPSKSKSDKKKKEEKTTAKDESSATAPVKSNQDAQNQSTEVKTTEKDSSQPPESENKTATQKVEKKEEKNDKPEENDKKEQEKVKEELKTEQKADKTNEKANTDENPEEKETKEAEAEKKEEKKTEENLQQEGGEMVKSTDKFDAIIIQDKEEIFKLLEEIVEKEVITLDAAEEVKEEQPSLPETKDIQESKEVQESKETKEVQEPQETKKEKETNEQPAVGTTKSQSSENHEKKTGSGITGRLRSKSREVVDTSSFDHQPKKSNKKDKKDKKSSILTSPNFSGKRKNEDKKKGEKNNEVDTAAVQIRPLNTKQKLKNLFGKRKSTTDPLKSASADIQAQIQQIQNQKGEIRSSSLDIDKLEKTEDAEELNKEIVLTSIPFVNENEISNEANQSILGKEDSLGDTPSSSQASLSASQDLLSNIFQSPPNSPGFSPPPAPFVQSNQLPTPGDLPPTDTPVLPVTRGDSLLKNQQIQSLLNTSGNSVATSSPPSSPPHTSTSPSQQSSPPQPSDNDDPESVPVEENSNNEKRKGGHRRHISSGDVSNFTMPSANSVNLDVAFILSRIIIPVSNLQDSQWEMRKMKVFEQQARQHNKEKRGILEEEQVTKEKLKEEAQVHLTNLEKEQIQEREVFNRRVQQEKSVQKEIEENDKRNAKRNYGKEKELATTKLTSKQNKDEKKTIDDFEKQISAIKKANKGIDKTGGEELLSRLQQAHKAHLLRENHKKQLNNLQLTQKHELDNLKNNQELEKKHYQSWQQLERNCLIQQLSLTQKLLRQKRWTILDDLRNKQNILRSVQEKKHQLDMKQEQESQDQAFKLLQKQHIMEREFLAKEKQENPQLQKKKKALKSNFQNSLKKLQKDKNLTKEEIKTKGDEIRQIYNEDLAKLDEEFKSQHEENEQNLQVRHEEQLNLFHAERKRRRDLLLLYQQKEKNTTVEELELERKTIEDQLKQQVADFEKEESDMKEAFTQGNEACLWDLQQRHWKEIDELQLLHHQHQQELLKSFEEEVVTAPYVDEEERTQAAVQVQEVHQELVQQQEAEKLQLEQQRAQEQEVLKVQLEEEKKEVMETKIQEDELTLKQEYIRKIANDTGLSEELIAKQLDKIGMPAFWF